MSDKPTHESKVGIAAAAILTALSGAVLVPRLANQVHQLSRDAAQHRSATGVNLPCKARTPGR